MFSNYCFGEKDRLGPCVIMLCIWKNRKFNVLLVRVVIDIDLPRGSEYCNAYTMQYASQLWASGFLMNSKNVRKQYFLQVNLGCMMWLGVAAIIAVVQVTCNGCSFEISNVIVTVELREKTFQILSNKQNPTHTEFTTKGNKNLFPLKRKVGQISPANPFKSSCYCLLVFYDVSYFKEIGMNRGLCPKLSIFVKYPIFVEQSKHQQSFLGIYSQELHLRSYKTLPGGRP